MKQNSLGYMWAKINFGVITFQIGTAIKNGTSFKYRRLCRKVIFLTI